MKHLEMSSDISHLEINTARVPTGVRGLDELLEGGLPRASIIILAGSPGSGKTIASAQFLHYGATRFNENGVYVSFSERKDTFERSMKKFGMDFCSLEKEGRFKFLDFATTTETGVSATLKALLSEVFAMKAKRLVLDSFTAMATAFEKRIEARIVLHAFEKLMRQAACTTILIVEVPTGNAGLGLGFEEFVADGLILFETIEDEFGIKKRAIIRKMRETDHDSNFAQIVISDQGVSLTSYVR